MLRHYLAAACDPLDAAGRVGKRGDELLRKRCAVDSPKPAVDLEDAGLVRKCLTFCKTDINADEEGSDRVQLEMDVNG